METATLSEVIYNDQFYYRLFEVVGSLVTFLSASQNALWKLPEGIVGCDKAKEVGCRTSMTR